MLSERQKYEMTPQEVAERRERFLFEQETTQSNVRSSIFGGELPMRPGRYIVAARQPQVDPAHYQENREQATFPASQPTYPAAKDVEIERYVIQSGYVPSAMRVQVKETPTFISQLKPHDEQIVGPQERARRLNGRAEMAHRSDKETFEMQPPEAQAAATRTTRSLYSHDAIFKPDLYEKQFPAREEFSMQIRTSTHPDVVEYLRASGRQANQFSGSGAYK